MAESFFLAAAANAVGTMMTDYLVKPIERRIRYLFRFRTIIKRLDQQKMKLTAEQARIQNEVKEAKLQIQTQVIEDNVVEWLTNAENALEAVQSLECRIDENKRCIRWCPNWSWRYRLSKEMDKETLDIAYLVENSKFERYGHRAELPGLEFFPSEGFVPSKSSTVAFNEIMEALKDEKVNMIGVWGMGGVGKTTLVNQVGSRVREEQLFNRVIKVVVSQTPIIKDIQEKIKDFLDLNFRKTTEEGRAEELWLRLKNEEKVLVILDDMWNDIDLKKIGLPLAENGKGCKIILTTRRKPVLESMKCQRDVPVHVLDDDEAWDLFKMKANLDERVSRDIVMEAQRVARECKGLPVAIVAVAGALKATSNRKGWEVARKKLETSRFMEIGNIAEDEKNAYKCIRLSYEYLNKETTKRCLSMCALYPEDHSVDVEDLLRSAWGLGLYKADSIEEARIQISDAIVNLRDSGLLLHDTERYVKLHDVVRDFVLWIASTEESNFVIQSRLELLDESSESCKAITLLDSEEKKFPERLVNPKLKILLLNYCDIQGTCFQMMNELKVLSLTAAKDDFTGFISLYALTFLPKLRALQLENFEDFSFLGNLRTLEILSLRFSSLIEGLALSCELGKLENLKILDLTNCRFSSTFPSNVIRRLSNLEELYLNGSHIGENRDDILLEMTFLTRLERYDIHVPDSFHLTERSWEINGEYLSKVISLTPENLEHLEVKYSTDEFVECLTDKTQLRVSVSTTLQHLKRVIIRNCGNLKVVFQMEKVEENNVGAPLLSDLRELYLEDLSTLSCIWDLPIGCVSLESLVKLRIENCPSLKILFPLFLAKSLVLLETLEISRCHGLKQLVDEECEITSTRTSHNTLWFPKLTKLEISSCDGLEYIFPVSTMTPQGLLHLRLVIKDCPQIKQVIRVENDNNVLQQQLQFLGSLCRFEVSDCPHLTDLVEAYSRVELPAFKQWLGSSKHLQLYRDGYRNLVPEVNEDGLNGLTSLDLNDCSNLECLVNTTMKNRPTPSAFTHLEKLDINAMSNLEALCKGQPPQFFLENLKFLKVRNCRNIVTLSPSGKLLNLRELYVRDCTSLQVVFKRDDDEVLEEENHDQKPLSNLQSLELQRLNELEGLFKGSPHSFSLHSLKVVVIKDCPNLEYLFPPSVIPSLKVLEELGIVRCDELKALFGTELENSNGEIHNTSLSLPKLKTISIGLCSKLEYALPITLAQGLPSLESISVVGCVGLKQVFSGLPKELDGAEHDGIVLLVSLQEINLRKLPELTSFVPENYIVKAPALKCLKASGCPRTWNFPLQQVKRLELEDSPLAIGVEFLRNTKDLKLTSVDELTIVPDVVDLEDLQELTSLDIVFCENLQSLVDMSGSCKSKAFLPNLKKLKLNRCDKLEQVFRIDELHYDKEENQAVPLLLLNLEHLDLYDLPSLRWIMNAASSNYVSLHGLKVLNIGPCKNLDYLFPVSVIQTLSSLENLIINRCDKLKSVFIDRTDGSNSGTLCLPKLKTVELIFCPSLEYVFPHALAPNFPRLQKLKLIGLSKLRHFVAGYDLVEAPALESLDVSGCRRCTVIIRKQVNNHVPLKDLTFCMQVTDGEDAESCDTVNTHPSPDFESLTMGNFEQLLHLKGGYFISSLEEMTLYGLIWLQHIWKGPIHVATNLRELYVESCNSLSYIFPVMLIRHYLPQLCNLRIASCHNLKQIIASDDNLASSSSQDPQLEMKMVFPRLKGVILENLPRLKSFSPVGYHLVFPCLEFLQITQNFKMITTFTVEYLTLTVHAKTDLPSRSELDDTSPSQEAITWSRRRSTSLPPFVEEGQAIC